jgi:uncharacterized protein
MKIILYLLLLMAQIAAAQTTEIRLQPVDLTPKSNSAIASTTSSRNGADTVPLDARIQAIRQQADAQIRHQTDSILKAAGAQIISVSERIRLNADLQISSLTGGNTNFSSAAQQATGATIESTNAVNVQNPPINSITSDSSAASSVSSQQPTTQTSTAGALNKHEIAASSDKVSFSSAGIDLTGFLIKPSIPKKPKYPLILLLHDDENDVNNHPLFKSLADDMNKLGFAVFFYNKRGVSLSNTVSVSDLALDASAALDALKQRNDVDTSKIGVIGIKKGGWLAGILNAMRDDIDFNVMVSTSTMTPADQMNFAAFSNLIDKGFARAEIDSAIRMRNLVDEYYRGRITFEQIEPFISRDSATPWYRAAFIPQVERDREKSTWLRQMNFDPLSYFKGFRTPVLAVYGEHDRWLSVDKDIYELKQLNLPRLETRRINLAGHNMIEFEKDNPTSTIISGMFRNILESWVKKQSR